MTREEMREKKRERNLTYQDISDMSGVPVATVQRILTGKGENPHPYNVSRIEAVLEQSLTGETALRLPYGASSPACTEEEYYAYAENRRCEWIDGRIVDLGAPSTSHQKVLQELLFQVESYIRRNGGPCKPYVAPVAVKLDAATIVEPDLFVLCDPEKDRTHRIEGAPDWVTEILSPSTVGRDCIVKLDKYRRSGVREYWIVDEASRTVHAYDFTAPDGAALRTYTGGCHVPVALYGGALEIDLAEVWCRIG